MRMSARLAVVPLVLLGALAAAAPASAAGSPSGCDQVVVDGAAVLGRAHDVRAAAAALAADGARVRVRTYADVPDGDLDAALAEEVRRCSSWHSSGSDRRPDLLVVAVDIGDRKTAISYGSRWTVKLDGEQESVQTDVIDPQLKTQEYGAAIAAGLTRLHELLTAPASAASAPSDTTVAAGAGGTWTLDADGNPVQVEDMPSPDPGGVGSTVDLIFIVGAAAVAVVLVAGLARSGGRGGSAGGSYPRGRRRTTTWAGGTSSGFTSDSGASGSFGSFDSSGSIGGGSSDGGGGSSTSW